MAKTTISISKTKVNKFLESICYYLHRPFFFEMTFTEWLELLILSKILLKKIPSKNEISLMLNRITER